MSGSLLNKHSIENTIEKHERIYNQYQYSIKNTIFTSSKKTERLDTRKI